MPQIIFRKDAIAQGLSKYFTGKPCSNGHLAERYTTSGTCEGCIRKSTALSLPQTVIEGQIVSSVDPRLQVINRNLDIKERELALKEKALELRAQNSSLRLQAADGANERRAKREKNLFIKENLITFKMLADEENYDVAVNMVWMAALMRNPEITKADVITGRQLDRWRHVMRCFPADQGMLLRETTALYDRRAKVEVEVARQQAIASAQSAEAAEINADWPEFKP